VTHLKNKTKYFVLIDLCKINIKQPKLPERKPKTCQNADLIPNSDSSSFFGPKGENSHHADDWDSGSSQ